MAESFALEKFAMKMLLRCVGIVLLIAALLYPLDWVVWRVRVARGGGMDTVQVEHFTVAELNGGKEDYYLDGTSTVPCSESLYPQGGNGVCWWVQRHPKQIVRY